MTFLIVGFCLLAVWAWYNSGRLFTAGKYEASTPASVDAVVYLLAAILCALARGQ